MRYRKKPVEVEAVQFNGKNSVEIAAWSGGEVAPHEGDPVPSRPSFLQINTLEGKMQAISGDWIIRGIKGEFYPCKPDIFDATYEAVP